MYVLCKRLRDFVHVLIPYDMPQDMLEQFLGSLCAGASGYILLTSLTVFDEFLMSKYEDPRITIPSMSGGSNL